MGSEKNKHIRDSLAANAHDAWSRWTTHLLKQCILNEDGSMTIPQAFAKRWKRQIATAYDRLDVEEQASDLHEADLILQILADSEQPQKPQPQGAPNAARL